MIAICADDESVEISGAVSDLDQVHRTIACLLGSNDASARIDAESIDPSPYPRVLSALEIKRTSGRTTLAVVGDTVIVSGPDDSLSRFSSWFRFPPDARPRRHAHFDPMPGDLYHSSESVPLIVSVRHIAA